MEEQAEARTLNIGMPNFGRAGETLYSKELLAKLNVLDVSRVGETPLRTSASFAVIVLPRKA